MNFVKLASELRATQARKASKSKAFCFAFHPSCEGTGALI